MNILQNILDRLNQKLDASNIFGAIYGLAEPAPDNPKQFYVYIGSGQGQPVTDYDKTQGTAFWRFRSAVTMRQTEVLRPVGCQEMYVATYPLRCYAFIRKSSMPCDSNAVEGWVMDMFWKYVSGKDTALRNSLGVTDVFFRPVSVTLNTPDLPNSIEWIHAYFDLDVEVTAKAIESCYDDCGVNPIPLPNGQCPPINRVQSVTGLDTDNTDPSNPIVRISVDGSTITGSGTPDDPLVSIGGGTGVNLRVQDEGNTVTNAATTLNFTGNVTASLASAGNVTVNVPAPTPQVNSDWNAVSGVAEILNKPTIPAAQIQSDWNQANNAAVDFIKNKPAIPSIAGLVPYTGATADVNLGTNGLTAHDLTVSHPSGSGVAVSVTKGGAGEALTVVKSSGSGNAASITGGVTLIDELHLNTDLADTYIASAATWNAKQDPVTAGTGISIASDVITNTAPDQTVSLTAGTGIGVSGTYPNFTIANTQPSGVQTKMVIGSATETSGIAITQLSSIQIEANWASAGKMLKLFGRNIKTGANGSSTNRIYINSANNLTGAVLLATYIGGAFQTSTYADILRHIVVLSATETVLTLPTQNLANDVANPFYSILNIDWSQQWFLISTGQDSNTNDVTRNLILSIERHENS